MTGAEEQAMLALSSSGRLLSAERIGACAYLVADSETMAVTLDSFSRLVSTGFW